MNLLEKVNILKMYIKNVKKSIWYTVKNIAIKAKNLALFLAGTCVFAAKKAKEAICHFGKKIAFTVKESMHPVSRTDIFVITALLIVIITPIIVNLFFKLEAKSKQMSLYVSISGEEIFGKELMESLMLEFEEKNPDIQLRFAYKSSAVEPDILFFNESDFSAFIAADALTELNSFTNYDSGARQMAVPLVSFMDMLFYNINILSAAGFDHPPKTRNEFLNYARAVAKGNSNAAGYALSLDKKDHQGLYRDIFSWIWASGGSFFSGEDGVPVFTRTINNDISFFGVLNREGLLAPDIFETTGEERINAFAQGRLAMMIASTEAIPYLRAKMGDGAFGVTTIPVSDTGGKYTISLSSIYAGISANTASAEKAWSFIAFLASKSPIICAKFHAVPGLVSNIIPGDYVKDDPFYSKAWDIFEASVITESFSSKPEAKEYENNFLEDLKNFFESDQPAFSPRQQ